MGGIMAIGFLSLTVVAFGWSTITTITEWESLSGPEQRWGVFTMLVFGWSIYLVCGFALEMWGYLRRRS